MKILFALPYPGFLRYFDETIRLLADRGHDVDVWFDDTAKQAEAIDAFGPHVRVRMMGSLPKRRDSWGRTVKAVRGTADFVRYLHPAFGESGYLRQRALDKAPRMLRPLRQVGTLPRGTVDTALRILLAVERATPTSAVFDDFVATERPNLVVAGQLMAWRTRQADLVRSARTLGVPSVAAVASWDNLTTKGMLRSDPDRVVVWNEHQAAEAVTLHFVPRERVVVTGAQPFDRWFGRTPKRSRAEFAARVGLPADRPYVLFVGSTASISAPEAERCFVRSWIEALRAGRHEAVAHAAVLVRPHPYNSVHWRPETLADLEQVSVFPAGGANPVDEGDRADFFDSIYHSAAVVGINTSAMIEAAVAGRPVLTIATDEFADTQGGTVHFHYLVRERGGFVRVASTLSEHADQLDQVLREPGAARAELAGFLRSFVRPAGLESPSTPILVEALEAASRIEPAPGPGRIEGTAVRLLLGAGPLVRAVRTRLARSPAAARRDVVGLRGRGVGASQSGSGSEGGRS